MGNTPLTIGLKVDDNEKNERGIVAGSILRGRIYLSNKDRKEVPGSSIRLKLIGTEEAVVYDPTRKTEPGQNSTHGIQQNRSKKQDYYNRSSNTIYHVDHTMKEYPGGVLPRGQFEFPFALQLPLHLPSTMKAESYRSHCEVRYEIIAEVFQKSNSQVHTNPHAKERLTVIAMPRTFAPDQNSSRNLPIEIIPIRECTCCSWFSCSDSGTMALQMRLDRTALLVDSPSMSSSTQHNNNRSNNRQQRHLLSEDNHNKSFGFQFRCENKSTSKITRVGVHLTETIEWCSHGHTEKIVKTLASANMDTLRYSEFRKACRKPFYFREHRDNDSKMSLLLEHRPWHSIDPSLVLDAASAHDTYNGRAVQVRHMLTLSVITEDCCGTNPDTSTRVEIYRNPLAFGAEQHSPEGVAADSIQQSYHRPPPFAPFEDEPSGWETAATAPSAIYDSNNSVHMVQAQLVLPEDWNAYAEEIVNFPIVEATVLEQ